MKPREFWISHDQRTVLKVRPGGFSNHIHVREVLPDEHNDSKHTTIFQLQVREIAKWKSLAAELAVALDLVLEHDLSTRSVGYPKVVSALARYRELVEGK